MSIVDAALPFWGLNGAVVTLIAARENTVYRVDHATGSYALRLHRQGYRTDLQLAAELEWMAWTARAGLSVPDPLASLSGAYLRIVEGVQVDVLNWLSGDTLDILLPEMNGKTRAQLFNTLGREMARLHKASDAWPKATTCDRPAWNVDGLLGDAPLWDRFWDNPGLTSQQKTLFLNFRAKAKSDLTDLAPSLDYGLIHADLVPGNALMDGEVLHFIDFDDGGFGFRLFELATALLKQRREADFDALKSALLAGYTAERRLDVTALDLFIALRAATYVGWNISRAQEDATGARNARFIAQAEDVIEAYCVSRKP